MPYNIVIMIRQRFKIKNILLYYTIYKSLPYLFISMSVSLLFSIFIQ